MNAEAVPAHATSCAAILQDDDDNEMTMAVMATPTTVIMVMENRLNPVRLEEGKDTHRP